MSGCQDLHSCTYTMTLTSILTKSVQSLLPSTRRGCSNWVHPLRVEFKYTVRGQGIITCNRDRWQGVWGVWGRSNLPQKSSTVSICKYFSVSIFHQESTVSSSVPKCTRQTCIQSRIQSVQDL